MQNVARANVAGLTTEAEALEAVVSRLVRALDPQAIWLFGSRATGAAKAESDFDLLVVGKPGTFGSEDYDLVDRAVRDLRIACDLVPCAAEDFEEGTALNTSFISEIMRNGRAIYRADAR